MESVTQNAINLALNGAIDLIRWEINNFSSPEHIHGLIRAVEIVQELQGRFAEKLDEVRNVTR